MLCYFLCSPRCFTFSQAFVYECTAEDPQNRPAASQALGELQGIIEEMFGDNQALIVGYSSGSAARSNSNAPPQIPPDAY